VAYRIWAPWFEQHGNPGYAFYLRELAAQTHAEVLKHPVSMTSVPGFGIPNSDQPTAFQTFQDGWLARPSSEAALNGTNWTYLAEVGYNPFTMELPKRRVW
jgi:hypothetical protein